MATADKKLNEVLIDVRGLRKQFGALQVLKGVDVQIHRGEVVVVIGPSGSGKSTFLRCLNLLEEPTGGDVIFEGESTRKAGKGINKLRERMGMVFQQFNLFPHLSVLDNVCLAPMKVKKRSKADTQRKALELLERVGLADKAKEFPGKLSGGQRQRVAIGRALITKPTVILADEPTGALDRENEENIMEILRAIHENGTALIIVTHDPEIADACDTRIEIDDGRVRTLG